MGRLDKQKINLYDISSCITKSLLDCDGTAMSTMKTIIGIGATNSCYLFLWWWLGTYLPGCPQYINVCTIWWYALWLGLRLHLAARNIITNLASKHLSLIIFMKPFWINLMMHLTKFWRQNLNRCGQIVKYGVSSWERIISNKIRFY